MWEDPLLALLDGEVPYDLTAVELCILLEPSLEAVEKSGCSERLREAVPVGGDTEDAGAWGGR